MTTQMQVAVGKVGRPYIGPKIQVKIPEEQYYWIEDELERRGLRDEDWPDLLREVVAAGVDALRGAR